jgi:hypothetical protein
MTSLKTALVMGLAAALVLTLGACREDERNRRVVYEPGVYKGKPDTPISAEAKRALRARLHHQNALVGGLSGGGGAPGSAPADVRPPSGAGSAIPLDALRQRTRQQSYN